MNANYKYILASSMMLILSACGGGGGGNDTSPSEPQPAVDTVKPTAEIVTPSKSQATTSRSIEVSGTAEDLDSGVKSVYINNILARSEDSFANWTVELPLDQNQSTLQLRAEDNAGNIFTKSYPTSLSYISNLFEQATQLAFIPSTGKMLILDANQNTFYESDTNKPNLVKLQGITFDNGTPAIDGALRIAYDTRNNQLIVLDQRNTRPRTLAFIAINLINMKASILKDGLTNISDFAIGATQDELYFFTHSQDSRLGAELSALSLDNQQIQVISDASNSGPDLELPHNLQIHGNNAFYVDASTDQLISINLNNGDRSLISTKNQNGISLHNTSGLAINSQKTRAWLTDGSQKQLIAINLSDGRRTIFASNNIGSGINFGEPNGIVYDEAKNLLYVNDHLLNVVLSVDPQTGHRDYLISNRIGHGPLFDAPIAIQAVSSELAYILDRNTKSLFSVNLRNGKRTLISDGLDADQGPLLESPASLTVDAATEKAWLTDQSLASVVEVDLTSGQRTIINAEPKQTTTPNFKLPTGIAYNDGSIYVSDIYHDSIQKTNKFTGETDSETGNILSDGANVEKATAIDIDRVKKVIYGVDEVTKSVFEHSLTNGYSRIISSNTKGNGITLESPGGIQTDGNQYAYISDAKLNAIIKVNLLNGNRDVLSNNSIGSGATFKEITALSFETNSQTLYVLDKQEKALFAVNIQNGNRALISR